MTRFKDKSEFDLSAFLICALLECKNEATHLLSTESNIVDVCKEHYDNLTMNG